ncbi:sensor histidine kinase [Cupriavidus sp. D39]|uniref:sensor histidine kinase n=1 Tax=Cupriavidus sp. D39 TaxID=2997877 RepID=UPI00226FB69A|nr:sensor histidine kinase [Cupriavidus sp. D39]MCY0853674.1 sensor histidine kinase [Cupriavidus sp. D39]
MIDTQVKPLRAFAVFLRHEQARLTAKWMAIVCADADLVEADKLTHEQLADHLPAILEGICTALDEGDLERVEGAIERNAKKHGEVRWQQGYHLDELVRELDLFRQVLTGAVLEFAETHSYFTRHHEARTQHLIDEALSFVTLTSIREVIDEQNRKINEYTGRLEQANHELTEKQRLVSGLYESRMQITRSVVHDLRNFLNAFSTALQLIALAPSKAEVGLALATRQAEDMKRLVDEMVEYSIILGDRNPLSVEQVELRALFDELVAASRPSVEAKGLHLAGVFDASLTSVMSNRLKLKQVALNLLSNATKFTGAGEIELAMGRCEGSHWYLRVSDTGIGIASSDKVRVFDEFERAAGDEIPGAGLGLSIVKELCRVLNGEIHFESRKGQGTTFEIRFPYCL